MNPTSRNVTKNQVTFNTSRINVSGLTKAMTLTLSPMTKIRPSRMSSPNKLKLQNAYIAMSLMGVIAFIVITVLIIACIFYVYKIPLPVKLQKLLNRFKITRFVRHRAQRTLPDQPYTIADVQNSDVDQIPLDTPTSVVSDTVIDTNETPYSDIDVSDDELYINSPSLSTCHLLQTEKDVAVKAHLNPLLKSQKFSGSEPTLNYKQKANVSRVKKNLLHYTNCRIREDQTNFHLQCLESKSTSDIYTNSQEATQAYSHLHDFTQFQKSPNVYNG